MIRSGTSLPDPGDEELQADAACMQDRCIEQYVTRRLHARTQREFELHLFACERCLNAVEFELLVKRAISDCTRFAEFSRSWH